MFRVGLVGESPNDTKAIANLFGKEYGNSVQFFELIRNLNGSLLDNPKTKRILRRQYESHRPDLVVFIRDLDALKSDKVALRTKRTYFAEFRTVVDSHALFLLNIYELEALILSDIAAFNKFYNVQVEQIDDPMNVVEPKEYLRANSGIDKIYKESDCPDLFKLLDFQKLIKSCPYFESFVSDFATLL